MIADPQELVTAFFTLFVIVDPIGLTPLFLALTAGAPGPQRRAIALRAVGIGFAVLLVFGLFGEAVLSFAGISMPAFRIAGGILLLLTALDMLFDRRTKRREEQSAGHEAAPDRDDPSVFPLATPLIAGPGAIASMILLTDRAAGPLDMLAVFAVMAAVLALVLVLFLLGGPLERALGPVGVNVVTRLLGMLLAALSVQFVLDGLRDFGLAPLAG